MTGLAIRATPAAIIAAYQSACGVIRRTFAALVDAEVALNLALSSSGAYSQGGVKIAADRNLQARFDDPDEAIKRLRRGVWEQLLTMLELQKFMSPSAWKEIQRQVDADEMPDITEVGVNGFIVGLVAQRGDIMADAVREVFDFLRPRIHSQAAGYKTNDREAVGPRVVLTWMVEPNLYGLRLIYDRRQHMLAMERVFQMLDGRGEISKSHYSEIEQQMGRNETSGETRYFRWKAHKNGTMHVAFVRKDLLAKFNAIAGGKNLRTKHAARDGVGIEVAS